METAVIQLILCEIYSYYSPMQKCIAKFEVLYRQAYEPPAIECGELIFDFCTDCHKYVRTFVWMLQEVERVPSYEF